MNSLAKTPLLSDGFDDYTDAVEGGKEQPQHGPIRGSLVKFTNEAKWILARTNEVLSPARELAVGKIARVLQKWDRNDRVETVYLAPGEKFPDVEAMNSEIPRAEWVKGYDGRPKGPFETATFVYLFDPQTMDTFSYSTGTTIGGRLAVTDLVERTMLMRKLRGANVFPVVTLGDTFMHTGAGGRQRPAFLIKDWIKLGGSDDQGSSELPALLAAPADEPTAEKPVTTVEARNRFKRADPPTLKEEVDDTIPF